MGQVVQNILVIDDDATVRDTVCEILRTSGYGVESANDGADGLKKYRNGSFDATVVDIIMPKKEGM